MSALEILMLTSEYPPRIGGVATHVAELARALRAGGERVTVVTPAHAGAATEPDLIRHSPAVRAQPVADWLLARWCRRLVADRRFDLVHVHGLRPLRAALATGLPVVFTNHTSGFLQTVAGGGSRLARLGRLLARCALVLAPSEELVEATRRAGYRGPARYVPNGVDDQRFTPGAAPALRQAWGLEAGTAAVVIARRLVPKNGVMDAARALAHTREKLRFVFVGDGPLRAEMEAEIAALGVADRALFTGALPNPSMPEVYRAADLCLLPSRMEATSIAGLEAMATGCALIGTRVGGIPALIDDGRTGLLVDAADPPALARAVDALVRDAACRARFGAAARLRVAREFAWPRIAERTRAAYRETLDSRVGETEAPS